MAWLLSPALTSASNRAAQPLDVCVAEVDVGHAEKGRDGLLGRITEIGAHYVRENILACRLRRLGRIVYVARAGFAVRDELFLAQDAKNGSNRVMSSRTSPIS